MIKIFHTGDIHLGMTFNSYGDRVREKLVEARFQALENMVEMAGELESHIFVVAGDLFNNLTVKKADIKRTVGILERFSGNCVLVLPGNHDYDNGKTELWKIFRDHGRDKLILLGEERPYSLEDYGLNILVYPAPCHNKHSGDNNLGWIGDLGEFEKADYHIGVGHGALEGLSADLEGNYYPMTMKELEDLGLDLWLLGHTHVQYPEGRDLVGQRIYNAGTPEPDGLNYRGRGSAWLISLDGDSTRAREIETGQYRFIDLDFQIESEEDLARLKNLALEGDPKKKLLRIKLRGRLNEDSYRRLSDFYRSLEEEIFYLIIDDEDLGIKVDQEVIEREFTKGSFPYEFLKSFDDEEAMQLAYELIRRD